MFICKHFLIAISSRKVSRKRGDSGGRVRWLGERKKGRGEQLNPGSYFPFRIFHPGGGGGGL